MHILSWLVVGLVAGFIGSMIVNKTGSGLVMDLVIGVVGAVVGGFIGRLLHLGAVSGLNIGSLFLAVVGAVVVLIVYRNVVTRS